VEKLERSISKPKRVVREASMAPFKSSRNHLWLLVSFACIYSQRQIGKGEVSYEGHGIHESKEKIPVREIGISS
jgi:hypothetical protein